ncbi:MAG: spondin domain-containing protein [Pseudomonadales bacterium]|nr:spondin domain-containing protein [Pseudomonadales bacterium]
MKKVLPLALAALASSSIYAADLSISITNLTRGTHFTPLLIAAHPAEMKLFTVGEAASTAVQEMAEGGAIGSLVTELSAANADLVENPAAGLLAPGITTMTTLTTADENTHLSVVAMVLPTNDAFLGLNGIAIPTEPGTYMYNVNAYDSGTEANDELRGSGAAGMPGFPFPGPVETNAGMNGSGVNATVEGFIHIHRNVLGDTDVTGGASDIDSTIHRWLNPVARVIVTVN